MLMCFKFYFVLLCCALLRIALLCFASLCFAMRCFALLLNCVASRELLRGRPGSISHFVFLFRLSLYLGRLAIEVPVPCSVIHVLVEITWLIIITWLITIALCLCVYIYIYVCVCLAILFCFIVLIIVFCFCVCFLCASHAYIPLCFCLGQKFKG